MENNKRCSRCGTDNEQEFAYCKNCGALLEKRETTQNNTHYTPISYHNQQVDSMVDYSEIEPEIEGVDTKKVQAYVGTKNCDRIMQRFITAFRTGKRVTGFNWVVFITGTLLVFPFVSAWFFYRKMYKVGAIICALSIALTVAVTAVNFADNTERMRKEYNEIKSYSTEELLQQETEITTPISKAEMVVAIIQFAVAVFLAISAWNIYYKQSLLRIRKLEEANLPNNNQFYQLAGLPSSAAAILIPLGVRLIEMIISATPAISLMLTGADIEKVIMLLLL